MMDLAARQSIIQTLKPFDENTKEHVDEIAFLWALRTTVIMFAHYTVSDVYKLESRIERHIKGLGICPDDAWEHALVACEIEGTGETFALAIMAFLSCDVEKIQVAVSTGLKNERSFKGLCSALAWLAPRFVHGWVKKFLASKDLAHKYLAINVCSSRRDNPAKYLTNILMRDDCQAHLPLYRRALRIVGELKRKDLIPALVQAQKSDDEGVAFWAHWSATLLGSQASIQALKPCVLASGQYQHCAIELVFRALPVAEAKQWITALSQTPEHARALIQACACLGDPQVIDWLIAKMNDPALARLSAEAFTTLTGIDLEACQLTRPVPAEAAEGPDDDPRNENVEIPEDEGLRWPDSQKIAAIWQTRKREFKPGQRYFSGQRITVAHLKSVLSNGHQRHRHAAALEWALLEPGQILINTRAKVSGQYSEQHPRHKNHE